MNSKGQFDLIEIIIALIGIATMVILVIYVNGKVTDAYKTFIPDHNSTAYKAVDKANNTFTNNIDKLFLGIFIILLLGMVILAFYIQSSPIFLVLFIIISIISTWFSAIISNVFMTIESKGVFSVALLNTPIMIFIMEHLPMFISGFAMILLIVTYSKEILFGRVGIEG